MKRFLRAKHAQTLAALIMAIVVWATTVGLGLNTGFAGAASVASRSNTGFTGAVSPNHRGIQKGSRWWDPEDDEDNDNKVLNSRANRDCSGQIVPPPPIDTLDHGFSIIHKTHSGRLIATIVLKKATPNATYNIRLIQTPNGSDCAVYDGTITTDSHGRGTKTIRELTQPGSSGAFVVLNNQANPNSDFFTTEIVPF
ncbi:hypothetical protein KDW_36580 [Dictyobacter vulcani]|uniref:Uncharacterized protein n=1 Tax=Dictyobacter vulcani TaxID=2607529 RepID=A0A5J4KWB1_9CHLR|nr:hypothetical protein [Dictyobacter vulcani]GER89496.1 hypothetical protein KDW_36580 [Dictyobacter vulcani]